MIEHSFDVPFIADLALREKQIQQNYRPVIAVHKWFARRPGTLFRGLLLAEFAQAPLREAFYRGHSLRNVSVFDPFMGGGTTLLEANRLGCCVTGYDINPMAYWIVREEIETLDLALYATAAGKLRKRLEKEVGELYCTHCLSCGSQVPVKYFLWVKTLSCCHCSQQLDLFPNYLIAEDQRHYHQMFNARQLLGLELVCCEIHNLSDPKVRRALATNMSDLLRYQNMLCRYDTMALKSLDVFSVHGFPIGLIQCESNLLGVEGASAAIGSGGWLNITDKFARAKVYCARPFEIRHRGSRKEEVLVPEEWIGDERDGATQPNRRLVTLACADASKTDPGEKFDAILTDPPYFGNVQYAELMDFCYVWLRRLMGDSETVLAKPSTRNPNELTGNVSMGRNLRHFTEGMSSAFRRMANCLKPGSPINVKHGGVKPLPPVECAELQRTLRGRPKRGEREQSTQERSIHKLLRGF